MDVRKEKSVGVRPVAAALFILILIFSGFVRTVWIDLRPLHNDEGVNHFFIEGMKQSGYYNYSHENYHGPSYFYLTRFLTACLGEGELGLRSSAVLMGVACILVLALLRKSEGWGFVLVTSGLLACSSSLVFFSRYAIHEALFVFAGALLAFSLYLWWLTQKTGYFYSGGLGLALLITTKETFIITLFCLFLSFLALGRWRATARALWTQRAALCGGLLLCVGLVVFIFTGGLQWSGGLREMFLAVPQWIGRNESDVGHFKPFLYYTQILLGPEAVSIVALPIVALKPLFASAHELWRIQIFGDLAALLPARMDGWLKTPIGSEPYLALAILLPVGWLAACRRRWAAFGSDSFALGRFLGVWTISSFLVYGLVSYKTAWLVINISYPANLFLGWCLWRLGSASRWGRFSGSAAYALVLSACVYFCYVFNFGNAYGKDNPFVYVHTRQGMLDLASDIKQYLLKHPQAKILIGVPQYWPLPYYLRDLKDRVGYLTVKDPKDYKDSNDILIVDAAMRQELPGFSWKYYRLSDVQESRTFFRRGERVGK